MRKGGFKEQPIGRLAHEDGAGQLAGVGVAVDIAAVLISPMFDGGRGAGTAPRTSTGTTGDLNALLRTADPSRGSSLFARCAACHSIGRGAGDLDGRNLYGVVGGPVAGRRPRYAYTAALRHLGGTWIFERLNAWLSSPAALAPGTKMVFEGLPDARDRADVIAYLNSQWSDLPIP